MLESGMPYFLYVDTKKLSDYKRKNEQLKFREAVYGTKKIRSCFDCLQSCVRA